MKNKTLLLLSIFFVILTLPNLIWIIIDRYPWEIDSCDYAVASIDLYSTLNYPISWLKQMVTSFPQKAPMLIWLGHLFLFLEIITKSRSLAILLVIIASQFLNLLLSYKIFLKFFKKISIACLGCLIMASAPLFVSMSTKFFPESLQLLSVTWILYILAYIKKRDTLSNIILISLALVFSISVRVSSLFFCLIPAGMSIWLVFKRETFKIKWAFRKHFHLLVAFLVLTSFSLVWFINNTRKLFMFRFTDSLFGLRWGADLKYIDKFIYWFNATGENFFLPLISLVSLVLILAGTYLRFKNKNNDTKILPISVIQILFVFFAASLMRNQISRYMLALLPYFTILICYGVFKLKNKKIIFFTFILFTIQFVIVQAFACGFIDNKITVDILRKKVSIGLRLPFGNKLRPLNPDIKDIEKINNLLFFTCAKPSKNNFFIVSRQTFHCNGSRLNFYALINPQMKDHGCEYVALRYILDKRIINDLDPEKAYLKIVELEPAFYIDLDPDYYSLPKYLSRIDHESNIYKLSIMVSKKIKASPDFIPVSYPEDPHILIYKYLGNK